MKKKETFYFSHDYSCTNDPKIQALLGKYGARGYGIYWRIVEILHEDPTHKMQMKPYVFEAISSTFNEPTENVKEIITYAVEVCELFVLKNNAIHSRRVLNNLQKRNQIKEARSYAGKKSAEARKKQKLTNVQQNATKESKVKESKVKENNIAIDFDAILKYFNICFNKNSKVFNLQNKNKLKLRLKEGYTLEIVKNSMIQASKDQFHKDAGYKWCTLEYFTRPNTLDKYGSVSMVKTAYVPTK